MLYQQKQQNLPFGIAAASPKAFHNDELFLVKRRTAIKIR